MYINSGEAQKAYDALIKKEKQLNEELAKTTDPKRIKALNAELGKLTEPLDRARKKLSGELGPSIKDLQQSMRKLVAEFERTGDPKVLAKVQALNAQLDQSKKQLYGVQEAQNELINGTGILGKALKGLGGIGNIIGRAFGIDSRIPDVIKEAGKSFLDLKRAQDINKLAAKENTAATEINSIATKKAGILQRAYAVIVGESTGAVKLFRIALAGVGIGALVVSVISVISLFSKLSNAAREASLRQKLINDINKEAIKGYVEEVTKLTIIKQKLNDLSIPQEKRILLAKEYNKTAEESNKIDISQINNINLVNSAIDSQINIIKRRALARAAESIIADRAEKLLLEQEKARLKSFNEVEQIFTVSPGEEGNIMEQYVRGIQKRGELARRIAKDPRVIKAQEELSRSLSVSASLINIDGLSGDSDKKKDSVVKKIEKDIKKLKTAWENLLAIQKLSREEVEKWGAATEKTLNKQEKTVREIMDIMGRLNGSVLGTLNGTPDNRIGDINKRMQQEQWAKEEEALQNKLDLITKIADALNTALSIGDTFFQAMTNRENAELERDRRVNDRKKANLENRLKSGLITQLQYGREIDRLQKEQEKKEREIQKKQFERQRLISISETVISGAEGAAKTIAKLGFPAAIPALIGIAATIAAKIALINSQEPKFAAGGKLGGRSHASGGNAVVDGSGRKIAEVEAGEGIVNKHTMADRRQYSVSGTPGQIISRLNSMYGIGWEGGATLVPAWRSQTPQRMNFAAMKSVYAAGGQFLEQNAAKTSFSDSVFENFSALMSDMQRTLQSLQQNGIIAYTVLTQHEKQVDRLAAIRKDATMVK